MSKIFNYEPHIMVDDLKSIQHCMEDGIASPVYINKLERNLSEFLNTEVVACFSGTSALHISLLACNIGPGDEVICPALTFAATWNSIIYTGATPIFCDVDPSTWCIDTSKIEELITDDTKAIMSVDLYGNPSDYDTIQDICDRHNLYFINDAAESFGSDYKNKPCAAYSDISGISFNLNKIITGNGGGAIVVNNDKLDVSNIRNLINQNKIPGPKYEYYGVGFNYRMSSFSAAILLSQLERFNDILDIKKRMRDYYEENLDSSIIFQAADSNASSLNYWMNVVKFNSVKQKNKVRESLALKDIECKNIFSPGECLAYSKNISEHCLALPSGLALSESQLKKITNIINDELQL